MKRKKNLIQAYKQAPWRTQLQWVGLFLLGLVLVAAITGVYLSINAQAAASGRMIQFIARDIDELNNEIAELTTELAKARSVENMLERSKQLGFRLINPAEAVYLEVPGYNPDDYLVLAPPRVGFIAESPIIRSSYKVSLWDWFRERIWQPSETDALLLEEIVP